jgi:hypothetical protein
MGQEQSIPSSSSSSMSILEPLSISVIESPLTCSQRMEQVEENMVVDPELIRAIMALTEQDTSPPVNPVTGPIRETSHPSSICEEAELSRMRVEAERDFAKWKQQRRLIKRLSRHDSSASTSSSFENGIPHSAPARLLRPHHTFDVTYIRRESSY